MSRTEAIIESLGVISGIIIISEVVVESGIPELDLYICCYLRSVSF